MTSFSSLRARLVGTVLVAITPALIFLYYTNLPWTGFAVGLLSLGAAWLGGERFIVRQVRVLLLATKRITTGDLTTRTGLASEEGELGDLARAVDNLAARFQVRTAERDATEKLLLNRSLQQTVVSALGQFALVSSEFDALLNQVVMLVTQTLEVEYCCVLQLNPDGQSMLLRAGTGWKANLVGALQVPALSNTQFGHTLSAGEPVVVEDAQRDRRFQRAPLLVEHGVVSGVTIAIPGQKQPFGILGAYTAQHRAFNEDEVHFLLAIGTVLAMAMERAQTESRLQKLAAFTQLNPNPAMELRKDGSLSYSNAASRKLCELMRLERPEDFFPPDIGKITTECLATGESKLRMDFKVRGRTLSWAFQPVIESQVVHAYVEDMTERLSLEAQLRQSQKMESIGQLAAGVAHDFNNMLTVMQGHAGMMLNNPASTPDVRESAEAISFAAERATALTRQLLMFSRKNVIQTKLLDLREVVSQMTKLLQRSIGETIKLELQQTTELPLVLADAGMVEQVLMNLAVNARDAMPKGGTVTVALRPVQVDAEYARTRTEARPGSFVCLSVRDTGCGMDANTMSRIFEPFFTTKEVGKGTGLGLATVYGIAKQHQGWIEVSSTLGKGTCFQVFFPASDKQAISAKPTQVTAAPAKGGNETILIVEDEMVLRDMAHCILENSGYRVLQAGSGPEALKIWEQNQGSIQLVLTDMVMPEGMTGVDLAQRLRTARPELPVIVASGYDMEEDEAGPLHKDGDRVAFLQKPYTHHSLTKAVRDSLDRRN